MKRIYTATSRAHEGEEDQRSHFFVSVDGNRWLEIDQDSLDRPIDAGHYDEIAEHFEMKTRADGSRHGRIALATRYLKCWCRELRFHDPIEVPQ